MLGSVAPSAIRVTMRLYDQAVETQVHRLLAKWGYQLTLTTNVTRITENRQVRHTAAKLDRNMPQRKVTVDLLVV